MALWTIGDLHLSLSTDKPMDIFGERWRGHDEKIKSDWLSRVEPDDVVVIPGDISWGISLDEAREDLLFLHDLPGKKILLPGRLPHFSKCFGIFTIDTTG